MMAKKLLFASHIKIGLSFVKEVELENLEKNASCILIQYKIKSNRYKSLVCIYFGHKISY
jgi:hypothetical protein